MTSPTIAFPAEAATPIAQTVVTGAARPVFGFGILATMLRLFKPLLASSPLEQRARQARLENAFKLQKLARDLEASEPDLAAELHAIAARA